MSTAAPSNKSKHHDTAAGDEEEEEEQKQQRQQQEEEREEHETGKKEEAGSWILMNKPFSELPVSELTAKAVREMNYTHLTQIQARSIPRLIEGRDVMAAAKTGSGKTLAFLIPAIELLYKLRFSPRNGTGVVMICPTRELAIQDVAASFCFMKPPNVNLNLHSSASKHRKKRRIDHTGRLARF